MPRSVASRHAFFFCSFLFHRSAGDPFRYPGPGRNDTGSTFCIRPQKYIIEISYNMFLFRRRQLRVSGTVPGRFENGKMQKG